MKIDLSKIDTEKFKIQEKTLKSDEIVYLVTPHESDLGIWNQENKIFRSSVWNKEGELISAGLPKFVDLYQSPENFPPPKTLKDCTLVEKIDGSMISLTKYKGEIIVRTRGTINAFELENGQELSALVEKVICGLKRLYRDVDGDTWVYSLIFEWTSPNNIIVIKDSDVPKFYLIGVIIHQDYSLAKQEFLDLLAKSMDVLRPKTYAFHSLENAIDEIKKWENKEGVVLYCGQSMHRLKSDWYKKLHKFRSDASLMNTFEMFCEFGFPNYDCFKSLIINKFDKDCWSQIQDFVAQVFNAYKEALATEAGLKIFLKDFKDKDRKTLALAVKDNYTDLSKFVFYLRDHADLNAEMKKKLLKITLEK